MAGGGLNPRYRGGTGHALDAAMHDSGNLVFVAAVPERFVEAVESALIWQFRATLPYNNVGKKSAPAGTLNLRHTGKPPAFSQS
jgi:hypothetical protein